MALPTVQFTSITASADSGQHAKVFEALSAMLEAAGWAREYIDADAIGTGTAAAPKWDAVTPAASAVAGRAIYSMPLNGHSRSWYVQMSPDWFAAGDEPSWRFRVGTGIDGSNQLTGAGSPLAVGSDATSSITGQVYVNASEDGFALVHCAAAAVAHRAFLLERARDVDGVVLDDLICWGLGNNVASDTTWPDVSVTSSPITAVYGMAVGYTAAAGLQELGVAASHVYNGLSTNTTTGGDGETNIPVGPIVISPQVRGYPRLALVVSPADGVEGTQHAVFVDGSVRIYQTADDNGVCLGYLLMATE